MGATETALKFELRDKIDALRKKEQEFKRAKDLSRAVHCKIVADFLADFLKECEAIA